MVIRKDLAVTFHDSYHVTSALKSSLQCHTQSCSKKVKLGVSYYWDGLLWSSEMLNHANVDRSKGNGSTRLAVWMFNYLLDGKVFSKTLGDL